MKGSEDKMEEVTCKQRKDWFDTYPIDDETRTCPCCGCPTISLEKKPWDPTCPICGWTDKGEDPKRSSQFNGNQTLAEARVIFDRRGLIYPEASIEAMAFDADSQKRKRANWLKMFFDDIVGEMDEEKRKRKQEELPELVESYVDLASI